MQAQIIHFTPPPLPPVGTCTIVKSQAFDCFAIVAEYYQADRPHKVVMDMQSLEEAQKKAVNMRLLVCEVRL